jgi:hypothetical protein
VTVAQPQAASRAGGSPDRTQRKEEKAQRRPPQ